MVAGMLESKKLNVQYVDKPTGVDLGLLSNQHSEGPEVVTVTIGVSSIFKKLVLVDANEEIVKALLLMEITTALYDLFLSSYLQSLSPEFHPQLRGILTNRAVLHREALTKMMKGEVPAKNEMIAFQLLELWPLGDSSLAVSRDIVVRHLPRAYESVGGDVNLAVQYGRFLEGSVS